MAPYGAPYHWPTVPMKGGAAGDSFMASSDRSACWMACRAGKKVRGDASLAP